MFLLLVNLSLVIGPAVAVFTVVEFENYQHCQTAI